MGQEAECTLRRDGRMQAGRAYLETDYVLFRGEDRLKILLKDVTAASAAEGVLRLEFAGGEAELVLGNAAATWARKILNPPSRAQKLGVKPGAAVRLAGTFEEGFAEELRNGKVVEAGARAAADLVFFAAERTADLAKLSKLAAGLQPDGALWVVYPKGVQTIREIEVIEAGRAAGLKDTKVAGFSKTHTALRFVIPVALRRRPAP